MASPATILICDDEASIRQLVASRLRGAGYTVVEARNGMEGYSACDHSTLAPGVQPRTPEPLVPALIVTDLQMPLLSGLEMAQRLRAFGPTSHVPVLMLTARGHVLDQTEVAKTNIRSLMAKPFGGRQLLEQVQALLAGGLAQAA